MIISDMAPYIGKFAPVLGSLLGSPIAGMGISLLFDHFKISDKENIKGLADAILQNPSKLKELELKHKEAMEQLLLDFLQKSEVHMPSWMIGIISIIMSIAALFYMFNGSLKIGG